MAHLAIMPKQGLQMTEGTMVKWLVQEGDPVTGGQPLFEIETDKLTIAIDAKHSGTLLKILRSEGDVVPVAHPVAIVGQPGEDISALLAAPLGAPEPDSQPALGLDKDRLFITPRAKMAAEARGIDYWQVSGSGPNGLIVERDVLEFLEDEPKATPLARKLAGLENMPLTTVAGSGARGKITAADVLPRPAMPDHRVREQSAEPCGAPESTRPATPPVQSPVTPERASTSAQTPASPALTAETRIPAAPDGGLAGDRVVPLSGMRRAIARRMSDSLREMAQACHTMHVDMSEAVRLRDQLKAAGVKISYNDIVIRCTARALTEFPRMNASMVEGGILIRGEVQVGMAVALDDGLVVPVMRNADRLTLPEIAGRSSDLAERARQNRLSPEDSSGGTFTVSNLGMLGVDEFTAIINPPEAGILAVGAITKRAVVVDDELAIRPMMTLCLTYDHRVVDGAPAARFLSRIRALLEAPALLI